MLLFSVSLPSQSASEGSLLPLARKDGWRCDCFSCLFWKKGWHKRGKTGERGLSHSPQGVFLLEVQIWPPFSTRHKVHAQKDKVGFPTEDTEACSCKHVWPSGWPLLKFALGVDSVKAHYGVSRSVYGPHTDCFEKPQNHIHFLADGRHVPARPQQWGVSHRLIARKLGNAVNVRGPWIVPDKWIKHCGQTISLFTYQESTVLLIHCFCFSFLL